MRVVSTVNGSISALYDRVLYDKPGLWTIAAMRPGQASWEKWRKCWCAAASSRGISIQTTIKTQEDAQGPAGLLVNVRGKVATK